MDLYVIRHAAAEERDSSRWPDDSKRPLTEAGRKKFRRVARLLRKAVDGSPVILASRWTRAWDTAAILAQETGWPSAKAAPALELQPNDRVLEAIRAYGDTDALTLVGHEPQLSELISQFLTGDADAVRVDLKKGAAVSLTLGQDIAFGAATLNWIITPRLADL